jgi:quercetin dioxygenase-like cupin family protein
MKIDKPWGHEWIWAKTSRYVGKILTIHRSHRLSYQYHNQKEETIYLMKGEMDLEYEESGVRKTLRLKEGQNFHIPPKMKHRMIAITDCQVVEVSTPELDDVVRLEDEYGRTGLR